MHTGARRCAKGRQCHVHRGTHREESSNSKFLEEHKNESAGVRRGVEGESLDTCAAARMCFTVAVGNE